MDITIYFPRQDPTGVSFLSSKSTLKRNSKIQLFPPFLLFKEMTCKSQNNAINPTILVNNNNHIINN